MAKKQIGVVPLWDEEKNSLWLLPNYLDAIRESGGIPVILPLHVPPEDAVQVLAGCDGLLMTGGHDISPVLYGQEKKQTCGALCEARDKLEQALYRCAVERDMGVLGICRGIQMVNVLEGGTLYQDLPTEHPSDVEHHGKPPYDQVIHWVNLRPAFRELLGTERLGVNSYHHQAIRGLGENLEILAQAEDGVVEAVRRRNSRFIWAVQWHPEFSFWTDDSSRRLFRAFVDHC